MKSYFSLYVVVLISAALSAISQADVRDRTNSLMSLLRHFNENRHHVTNPQGKERARDFIKKTFKDLGLKTWSEEFQPDHPEFACGHNIVGMIPGTLAGSPDDRLFLIGAHYDTVRNTYGADDNGSGVVALLQVAKQIVADFKTCSRRRPFSILFVAFDFEEWENCSNAILYPKCACGRIDCGSRAYVANLTRFYNGSLSSKGNLLGAIIMDTLMNYNTTPYSQSLPQGTEQEMPEVYNQIEKDEFRGNFLAVIGRDVDEKFLMDLFHYHYNQVKSEDGMEEWEVALLAIGMILVGVLKGVVAVVCHQRWKKQQGPLVTTRDLPMQSSTNPDNTV
ncbi:uncharacterized protein [Montipora capricornis]|uniref:uncharacterized protein isoform X2 n=1 Tax=Montipora capricornis TaxID=246305 RepID=UPI0035F19F69